MLSKHNFNEPVTYFPWIVLGRRPPICRVIVYHRSFRNTELSSLYPSLRLRADRQPVHLALVDWNLAQELTYPERFCQCSLVTPSLSNVTLQGLSLVLTNYKPFGRVFGAAGLWAVLSPTVGLYHFSRLCCGARTRTWDLLVMSQASYHCSTPRCYIKE